MALNAQDALVVHPSSFHLSLPLVAGRHWARTTPKQLRLLLDDDTLEVSC